MLKLFIQASPQFLFRILKSFQIKWWSLNYIYSYGLLGVVNQVKFLRILEMQVPNDSHSVFLSFQTKNNRVVFLAV